MSAPTSAPPIGDMKVLRNRRESRPELSILQYNGMVYGSRATEYGADKYARGNYFGVPPAGVNPVDRFAEYISAAIRHLGKIAQAINVAKGTGGDLRAACAVVDDEASGGFPPSMLPHLAHAIAGLMILVECGVTDGLLPVDPGQPWKNHPMYEAVLARRAEGQKGCALEGLRDDQIRAQQGLPQKDDPDAERRRVELLGRRASDRTLTQCTIDGRVPGSTGGLAADLTPGPADLLSKFCKMQAPDPSLADATASPSYPSGVRL